MTRRARMLLDALEDGCATRHEIHAHAGAFFLTNNAASDLRRAGIEVEWDRSTDTYHLLGGHGFDYGAATDSPPSAAAVAVEENTGQLVLA